MSQKLTPDSAQKGFAVGRGLLAAAETLNFSMNESRPDPYGSSSQQHGGMGGVDSQDSQLAPRRVGNPLSNTMKLFASLGLSPDDLDALAQVPEENISVETLPHLIMQLKNRKTETGRHLSSDLLSQSLSPDPSYRGGRDDWGDVQGGRLDRSAASTSQSRTSQSDFGYSSSQDLSARSYDLLDYGSAGGSRDRQYSELPTDRYRGLGTTSSSASDDLFMQRRMGSPSQGKVQDFLGVTPHMFPHVCSLCDFDVHSSMEWTQHTTGMRHAENRRVLLQMYPDWDPQMPSGRMSDSLSLSSKSRSDGLLGAAPSSLRQRTSMSSSWGSTSSMSMSSKSSYSVTPKIRSRVVVVKYDEKPKLSALFALASRFGHIREHLVLKNKAFLELMTHEEALAMTNYYQNKPATLHGRDVKIYLSKELLVIEKNERPDRETRNRDTGPVVFFSNLPRETEKKAELLTIARRFGTVVNHLFLNDQAFVQMSNSEDAEMLVKYYTIHPLTISRRTIHMNICTKYKTLTVRPGKGEQLKGDMEESGQKNSSSRTTSRSSSKTQRSSSSRAKESSSEKAQESKTKEGDEEVRAEAGSGDEVQGVVEAHDDEEETLGEDLVTEESVKAQPDQEAAMETEDSAVEPEEEETKGTEHDGANAEIPAEEEANETKQQTEQIAEQEEDQEQDDNTELKETDGQDDMEQNEAMADDSVDQDAPEESDFPEDMDEFVTLDELAEEEEAERHDSRSRDKGSSGKSRDSGGLRVVNVVGFKRNYGYLDEILALAKPFGKVVRHLVLHSRPEAFLEFSSEQEARSMVHFYNGNVIPSVCGKTVKIYHSMTYATIQSGKVVYIGHIPAFKSSDASFLKVAEPFGKIRRYYLNRSRSECFIEMERGEDAEKFVESARLNPLKFEGKRLLVYISRKYKQLKHGHRPPTLEDKRPAKREHSEEKEESQSSSSAKTTTVKEEEPPSKKSKEEKPSEENTQSAQQEIEEEKREVEVKTESCENEVDVDNEHTEEQNKDASESPNVELKPLKVESDIDVAPTESSSVAFSAVSEKSQELPETPTPPAESVKKPETTVDALGPYEPNVPVGVEFVKMGYYCRVCFLFYSNEDTAKKVHCSSQAHYEKLKKHLEKEKAKAQSNPEKK
ncbi:matrin 3-like 1.2 isoform 2-T2 [Clarias gariepinus]|uniref:matrin 3-like 1.2 isoform X2 n=1 Tax=Clarias gariepinus TaxID=13013 RepID=UPI00234C5108|nr:matrin 3-like 1.2 isoform X2 [Clarias gariepinus]